ncbi:hypothetical protein POG22_04485 [Geitlerinema sp. CS-897]|nr:hypothetical protein [Geitlerinema sp. CS-897]
MEEFAGLVVLCRELWRLISDEDIITALKKQLGSKVADQIVNGVRDLFDRESGLKQLNQAQEDPNVLEAVIEDVATSACQDSDIKKELEHYFSQLRQAESKINTTNVSGVTQNLYKSRVMGDVVGGDKVGRDKFRL